MGSSELARLGGGAAIVALVVCTVVRGRSHPEAHPSPATRAAAALIVPMVAHGPAVDGELDDDVWAPALRSGPFRREDGNAARPHSEARLVWGDGQLFVGLYAADDDVRAPVRDNDGPVWLSDAFQIRLRTERETFQIDVSPRGTLTDARSIGNAPPDFGWSSGARLAADVDGTIDDGTDRDEEWVVEMAIPLASLHLQGRPGERLELAVRRCDELREGGRACGSWGTEQAALLLALGAEHPLQRASIGRPR